MTSRYMNAYQDPAQVAAAVSSGNHRNFVGGMWDEIGPMQLEFLIEQGLTPEAKLLDVGCGCLRGGVHFVRFLDPGNYYGIDISQSLLDAGYDVELRDAGLQDRLPRSNLNCNATFDAESFGVKFDVALAQSVFTHLPVSYLEQCLARAADYVRPGGLLYATVFLAAEGDDWSKPTVHSPGGIITKPDTDPFHYQVSDVAHAASGQPWSLLEIRDWNHPRDQKMAIFRRDQS